MSTPARCLLLSPRFTLSILWRKHPFLPLHIPYTPWIPTVPTLHLVKIRVAKLISPSILNSLTGGRVCMPLPPSLCACPMTLNTGGTVRVSWLDSGLWGQRRKGPLGLRALRECSWASEKIWDCEWICSVGSQSRDEPRPRIVLSCQPDTRLPNRDTSLFALAPRLSFPGLPF